jgi:hypothetical protein
LATARGKPSGAAKISTLAGERLNEDDKAVLRDANRRAKGDVEPQLLAQIE